jgi:4-hydroxy-3-polyprenylbenzoate decarboxylase
MASEVWNVLEHAGIPGVTGVWFGLGLIWPVFLVISIKQSYAGQAKQAALAAASCRANTVGGMYVVVVDDDIDITNEKDVLLAVAARATIEDIQVIHGMITKAPMGPGSRRHRAAGENRQLLSNRVLIDACWPFARRDEFPHSTAFDQAYAQQVLEKWKGSLL